MTPPCYTFPAAELQERVQLDVHGRQRKMLPGSPAPVAVSGKPGVDGKLEKDERPGHLGIDLARDCTLLSSMVQYSCAVMHPEMRDSPVPGPPWELHGGNNSVGRNGERKSDWRRGKLKWEFSKRLSVRDRNKCAISICINGRIYRSRAI
ncbi:hypothetical protein SBRCBS47491_002559 [Sporothrix bragantina]|uniref:Uncharacterized protein n=1 Tax=Sporothrix bragantina TaxID=671064 RepID=A0ABP0B7X2_9PEZI